MIIEVDPKDTVDVLTPSKASILLTLALVKILGHEVSEAVIGDEAAGYLADWPYRATRADRSRLKLLENDVDGKLFRHITETLMPAIGNAVFNLVEVGPTESGTQLTYADMEAIETLIREESQVAQAPKAEASTHGGPIDDSPYC